MFDPFILFLRGRAGYVTRNIQLQRGKMTFYLLLLRFNGCGYEPTCCHLLTQWRSASRCQHVVLIGFKPPSDGNTVWARCKCCWCCLVIVPNGQACFLVIFLDGDTNNNIFVSSKEIFLLSLKLMRDYPVIPCSSNRPALLFQPVEQTETGASSKRSWAWF